MMKIILIATMMYNSPVTGGGYKTSTTEKFDTIEECMVIGNELKNSFAKTSIDTRRDNGIKTGITKGDIKCITMTDGVLVDTKVILDVP